MSKVLNPCAIKSDNLKSPNQTINIMAKKNVKFMLTAFRDGFQSVVGARVLSKDFLPCVEEAYAAGVPGSRRAAARAFRAAISTARKTRST